MPPHGASADDAAVLELARLPADEALRRLGSSAEGLDAAEAARRRSQFGPNRVTRERDAGALRELWGQARNPLNGLLVALALASLALGDLRAASVIGVMVVLAILLGFAQEHRASRAAARLRAMVRTTASVARGGAFSEEALEDLVPGDVVRLAAGDMVPADVRLLEAKDLFANQATLTGEAMPVEKDPRPASAADPFDVACLGFLGATVVSGYGTALVVRTGPRTYFGRIARDVAAGEEETAFDRGIRRVTWLMIRLILVMVPAVFLINGLSKHDWIEALFFAVAVGVGLTPELLPMIVTVNLASGALALSRRKAIVKRLDSIQDLGAMDVLCTDKTGTLTQDRILLKRHLDVRGVESEQVLRYAFLNSYHQSGLRNLLDEAILAHVDLEESVVLRSGYAKVDEVPFDFERRRMSVVLSRADGRHVLVCKGALEEVFAACSGYATERESGPLDASHLRAALAMAEGLNADGFRVVAVALKEIDRPKAAYSKEDESGLTLVGYVAFLDPPKESAREALRALDRRGVEVKILTGDNEVVTRKVCREVGLDPGAVLLGHELARLDDAALAEAAHGARVFAKMTPDQKERVVRALRAKGHVVGFLGDGINDSPALKAADVGISVDSAVDIAKESADIILLEKNLLVLEDGVTEGRRVFGNIEKYVKMGASSNLGNMLSVLGASLFLPFLPMLPIQVLTNNLLYDISQTTIPTDRVDPEFLEKPRPWEIGGIFAFMAALGPVSSLFDYATFGFLLAALGAGSQPALFQTGWFVESILTQTLVIHVIRTSKVPFVESRASGPLLASTALVAAAAIALPFTPLGAILGFVPLPAAYWPLLVGTLLAYFALANLVKRALVRRRARAPRTSGRLPRSRARRSQ